MKKIGILNRNLSKVTASLGHMDTLVIADAGLPIPSKTECVDLALIEGIPPFIDTLRAVLGEICVERAIIADEMIERSPELYKSLQDVLGDIPVDTLSHQEFKAQTGDAHAVVRTGEFTPYANVILVAGVVF